MDAAILMALTVWLGLAAVVAVAARNRERSAVLYFRVSVVASPILAIILLAISGGLQSKKTSAASKKTHDDRGRV